MLDLFLKLFPVNFDSKVLLVVVVVFFIGFLISDAGDKHRICASEGLCLVLHVLLQEVAPELLVGLVVFLPNFRLINADKKLVGPVELWILDEEALAVVGRKGIIDLLSVDIFVGHELEGTVAHASDFALHYQLLGIIVDYHAFLVIHLYVLRHKLLIDLPKVVFKPLAFCS